MITYFHYVNRFLHAKIKVKNLNYMGNYIKKQSSYQFGRWTVSQRGK